jgi:hypothetical protein
MEQAQQNSKFKVFISKILELPLWVRQVIYVELKDQLETYLTQLSPEFLKKHECFQLYTPKITPLGKKELETRAKDLPINFYKFLDTVLKSGLNIIEITITHAWNLSECAVYFITALKYDFIEVPKSNFIIGTALYLSGSVRLGEYFVKLDKISIDQLEYVLRSQQHMEMTGVKKGTGEILVDSGLVTAEEIENILFLKEQCKKQFFFDINLKHTTSLDDGVPDAAKYKEQIERLTRENQQLKDQLRKFFNGGK